MGGMKPFETYQHIPGTPMTDRDKEQVGSKFWDTGKWDNFVAPFLPEDASGLTFVDMGCNAGLFLKLAQDRGFSRIVGVESNKEAIERGLEYRNRINGQYELRHGQMENALDHLPMADYIVFANAHYYYSIVDWLKCVDQLRYKTINCIIVTARKKPVFDHTSSDPDEVRGYFEDWIDKGSLEIEKTSEGKHDREMTSLMFQSRLERVEVAKLDNGNRQQRGFLDELDAGKHYRETEYYRRFYDYRITKGKWSEDELNSFFEERVLLYEDMKKNGLTDPIIVKRSNMRVVDGNHRAEIARHLNFGTVFVRWVL